MFHLTTSSSAVTIISVCREVRAEGFSLYSAVNVRFGLATITGGAGNVFLLLADT
jgi:hypothetical protein